MTVETRTLEAPVEETNHRWILLSYTTSEESGLVGGSCVGCASATFTREAFDPISALWLPLLVKTTPTVPRNVTDVIHEIRGTRTTFGRALFGLTSEEDRWEPARQTVTQGQVDELKRIWALPYHGDVELDFRTPE